MSDVNRNSQQVYDSGMQKFAAEEGAKGSRALADKQLRAETVECRVLDAVKHAERGQQVPTAEGCLATARGDSVDFRRARIKVDEPWVVTDLFTSVRNRCRFDVFVVRVSVECGADGECVDQPFMKGKVYQIPAEKTELYWHTHPSIMPKQDLIRIVNDSSSTRTRTFFLSAVVCHESFMAMPGDGKPYCLKP